MKIITFCRKKIFYLFLAFLTTVANLFAQPCPTVVNPSQTFCDLESPIVSSLVATNNGNGVVWYATASSTTPLLTSIGLINGEDYFADDNSGTCGARQRVVVTIFSAPTGLSFQGVCVDNASNATISDLIATGNNVQWYSVPVFGTPLLPTTVLNDNTIYYASQINPNTGCETSRLSVFVNVGVVPVPTGAPVQNFCNIAGNNPTVGDLVASGDNNWYSTISSASPLPLSTLLVNGQSYFATTVDPPCQSLTRLEVQVNFIPQNNSGSNGVRRICISDIPTTTPFNLFGLLGGTPDNTGVWSGPLSTSNGFLGTINVSTLTVSGSPYIFNYAVSSSICPTVTSSVTIEVLSLPTASFSASTTICSGSSASVTFTGTPNATVTYTINGGSNQTILLNNLGVFTLTNTYINSAVFNLVGVASSGIPSCSAALTGTLTITVLPPPTVSISTNTTICSGSNATVTFTGTPNATVTYTINGGSNQTIVLNNLGIATLINTYSATTTFALVSIATNSVPICTRLQTGTMIITVIQPPTVSISSNVSICPNTSATVTFTGTPNATVTYTINGGSNQTIVLNNSGIATITNIYVATTIYNLVSIATSGIPVCSRPQTGTITITVIPVPVVAISANTTICSGSSATVSFTGTPNATVSYTINGGSNQTIVLNATGTATLTNTFTTTTIYSLVSVSTSGIPSCSIPQTGTITITVLPLPIVSISSNVSICPNGSATVTFTGTPNATVIYTINGGSNQTIVLNSVGTASITNTYAVTTTFALVSASLTGSPTCAQPQTGTVIITVIPLPTVSISSNVSICPNGSATVTFTGTPNATVTYTINGGSNQTIVLNAAGTATITNTYTTTTVFTLVSIVTSGSPNCSVPQTGTVTITVIPPPTVTISGNTSICPNGTATVVFTGTPNATITYTINGGSNQTIVLNAAGTATIINTYPITTIFTLVSASTSGTPNCSQPQTGTVTITVIPPPAVAISASTSICSGSSATVTFTGTPNATVIYTINGGSNQSIVLNSGGTATITNTYSTTTIYTLVSATVGNPGCSVPQTGTITITVIPVPVVTISANTTICSGSSTTVTFTGTPNATVTYTINGGSNQTIVLNATGTATLTNTFTTTTIYSLVSVSTSGIPSCSQPQTGTITITVILPPEVTISADAIVCSGLSATVTFTGTPNATVAYTINGGSNQSIILDNNGLATLIQTYTATTIFALVSATSSGSPGCSQPQSGTVTITVLPLPNVVISSNQTICSGSSATVTFTGTPNAIVTYFVNGGSNQTIQLDNAGSATIINTYSATAIFQLVNISSTNVTICSQLLTAQIVITVLPLPTVSISSNQTICSGSNAIITFTGTPNSIVTYNINNGNNQTISIGNSGIVSITNNYTVTTVFNIISIEIINPITCSQIQTGTVTINVVQPPNAGNNATFAICANSNSQDLFLLLGPNAQSGGTWSPALSSGSSIFNPAIDLGGIYTYTLVGTFPCPSASATVNVEIRPIPNAGNDVSADICSNQDPIDLFSFLTGSPQLDGIWSPTLASGSGIFNPTVDTAGIYTYTIIGVLPCVNDSALVTVNIVPGPNAGLPGTATFCLNNLPQDLFLSLNGTPQVGGTWTPTLSSGSGIFNPAIDLPGEYTYTFEGNQPCDDDTAIVTVIVNPIPDAGENGTASICSNQDPIDLFTFLNGTPQIGGVWTPTLSSGTGIFNPAIDPELNYTYTVGNPFCPPDSAVISVTIIPGPDAGLNGTLDICKDNLPQDLLLSLNGTPQIGGTWTPTLASGTGIFNPSIDIAGIYTYSFGGPNQCDVDSATVTVSINPIPNAGTFIGAQNVCLSVGAFDLLTLLNGNQSGGLWTDNNNIPVTNPIDVSVLAPNTYNYTYTISNNCGTDSETVEITVFPNPALNQSNVSITTPICSGTNATVSFSGMIDGNYIINYELAGSNILFGQSAPLSIVSGVGNLVINSFDIPNNGSTTITFLSIVNVLSLCSTQVANVTLNFIIDPTLNLEDANLSIANICVATDAVVLISNATGLTNGDYQFNYTIQQPTPLTGSTGTITITDGIGQFSIPAVNLLNPGNNTLTINSIISILSGCNNLNENAAANFQVNPIPDAAGALISVDNSCLNEANQVLITGAIGLSDGIYNVFYQLSGANTASSTTTIAFSGGNGSFIIPASEIVNIGNVTLTISQLVSTITSCGTGLTFVQQVIFNVTSIGNPILIANGEIFCANQNSTIADLSDNIVGTETVIWYSALTGGNVFASTDLLVNGTSYYATLVSSSGCVSATRLLVTVVINQIGDPILINNGNQFCSIDNPTIADLSGNIVGPETVVWYDALIGGTAYSNTDLLIEGVTYFATLIASNGCESQNRLAVTIFIDEIGDPILNVGGNVFCNNINPTIGNLSANIVGTETVVWFDSPIGGNSYDASDLLINGTIYYATLVTTSGCESANRLAVTVNIKNCIDIIVPDGFSPNDDQVNDEFVIVNLRENYPRFKLEVYNRYGNILYKGNINSPNWNGTTTESGINIGSSKLPVGVYFYIIEFNDGIKEPKQGRVYLSR